MEKKPLFAELGILNWTVDLKVSGWNLTTNWKQGSGFGSIWSAGLE